MCTVLILRGLAADEWPANAGGRRHQEWRTLGYPGGGVGLLSELAIASYLYSSMTTYNASLQAFREQTDGRLSLANRQHRYALVRWLNAWDVGCLEHPTVP